MSSRFIEDSVVDGPEPLEEDKDPEPLEGELCCEGEEEDKSVADDSGLSACGLGKDPDWDESDEAQPREIADLSPHEWHNDSKTAKRLKDVGVG